MGGRAAVGIGESGGDAGGGLRLKGVTFAHLLLGKLDSVTACRRRERRRGEEWGRTHELARSWSRLTCVFASSWLSVPSATFALMVAKWFSILARISAGI